MIARKTLRLIAGICLITLLVITTLMTACQPAPATSTAPTGTTSTAPGTTTAKPTATTSTTPTTTVAPVPSAATVYKWRLQSHVAPGIENDMLRSNAKNISDMSGGRIAITVFDGGALVAVEDEFTAVKSGMIELIHGPGSQWAGFMPEGDLEAGIPFMWRNMHDVETILYDRGMWDLLQQAYNAQGAQLMEVSASAPFTFWTKKDIVNVDGFKGLKIRSFGLYLNVLQNLGAAPVFIAHAETYTALATGVIDGSSTAAYIYQDLKNYEVCKHYYTNKWGMPTADVVMNLGIYKSLPADLQAIMNWGWRQNLYDEDRVYTNTDTKMEANMTKDWGSIQHTWPASEMAKITAAALPLYDTYAKKNDRCAKIIALVQAYMKEVGYL